MIYQRGGHPFFKTKRESPAVEQHGSPEWEEKVAILCNLVTAILNNPEELHGVFM